MQIYRGRQIENNFNKSYDDFNPTFYGLNGMYMLNNA